MIAYYFFCSVYAAACIFVISNSISRKVKGTICVTFIIVLGTAMVLLRPILSSFIASIIDSALFLVLLLWIVVINKHNTKRRKEQ